QGDGRRGVGGGGGRDGPTVHLLRWLDERVLEDAALYRASPEVLVDAEGGLGGRLDGDAVLAGVVDLLLPGHLPLPRGGDHAQVGGETGRAEVEPNLVVPLAGASVRNVGRAL